MVRNVVVGETPDDEEDGQDYETTHLDRFPAQCIESSDGDPVARHRSGKHNDEISDGRVVEKVVGGVSVAG